MSLRFERRKSLGEAQLLIKSSHRIKEEEEEEEEEEKKKDKKAARNVVVIVAGYRGKVTKLKARKAPAIWRKSGKEISTSIREQMEKGFKGRLEKANRSGK
ncbi:hypothetical protein HZH68_001847 [Vespula germanica]|uniref:Uncharacterized protein n=1 Tax=Vespula germanica TaxID=30212 RepID=A0A834NM10_VESGE|nr:hypothetical protein HZH68_001847 [Vespula germanica]